MDVSVLDESACQQRSHVVDRGSREPQGQGTDVQPGADAFPHDLSAGARRPVWATRRLRRVFAPARTRLVPVVLGVVVGTLALVFVLTGDISAILLLVPSALLASVIFHAVATSPPRAVRQERRSRR